MLAFPPSPRRGLSSAAKSRGFTLVELLTVVAIIMILAGIAIGVQRGAYGSQADAKARAEMHSIANALELYKATYGTYPVLTVPANAASSTASSNQAASNLVLHLTGRAFHRPHATNPAGAPTLVTLAEANHREPFLNLTSMKLNSKSATNPYLVDPWGFSYGYGYERLAESHARYFGDNFFILYSKGPDRAGGPASNTPTLFASPKAYLEGDSTNQRVDDIVYGLENLK